MRVRYLAVLWTTFTLAICFSLRADEPQAAAGGWQSLFDGKTLAGWKVTDFGGEGEVTVEDGQIIMRMGQPLTGITWKDGASIPTDNFEISLQAMKRKGDDFFCALTFPVRDSHATFVVGGWAGVLADDVVPLVLLDDRLDFGLRVP